MGRGGLVGGRVGMRWGVEVLQVQTRWSLRLRQLKADHLNPLPPPRPRTHRHHRCPAVAAADVRLGQMTLQRGDTSRSKVLIVEGLGPGEGGRAAEGGGTGWLAGWRTARRGSHI